jgi:hypothetical protein
VQAAGAGAGAAVPNERRVKKAAKSFIVEDVLWFAVGGEKLFLW